MPKRPVKKRRKLTPKALGSGAASKAGKALKGRAAKLKAQMKALGI